MLICLQATWALSLSTPGCLSPCHTPVQRSPQVFCAATKKAKKGPKKGPKKVAAQQPRGFGAPAAAATPAVSVKAETEEHAKWRSFERHLTSQGATIDAIELAVCDGIRGVRTTRSLKPGEEVLRIPRELILDEDAADVSPIGQLWGGAARDVPLPAHMRLALLVLHESRLGEQSRHAEYCAMLPSQQDFEEQGGPASLWSDAELEECQCSKLCADAAHKRRNLEAQLEALGLPGRWEELQLPGDPPDVADVSWAVAAVTSRAYGATPSAEIAPQSMMIPMVDMANHVHPPHTVKGLSDDGSEFIIVAREPIKRGEQLFLSYGPLPSLTLLLQFGFVLHRNANDFGLVDCTALLELGGGTQAERVADEGLLMREAGGQVSAWQPSGPTLRAALLELARGGAVLPQAPADADAQQAADVSYAALLRNTLETAASTVAEDRAALRVEGLPPRQRLALEFRAEQKALLNAELAASAAAPPSRARDGI